MENINTTKSSSDQKQYRVISLKNGMRVLLVSHNETESSSQSGLNGPNAPNGPNGPARAAITVTVGIGSFADPSSAPGARMPSAPMLLLLRSAALSGPGGVAGGRRPGARDAARRTSPVPPGAAPRVPHGGTRRSSARRGSSLGRRVGRRLREPHAAGTTAETRERATGFDVRKTQPS